MTERNQLARVAVLVLFVATGCGASAKVQPIYPPSSNLDELQHRLAEQQSVIDNQLGPGQQQGGQPLGGAGQAPSTGASVESAPPAAPPAPPPQAAEAPPGARAESSEEQSEKSETSAAQGASAGSTCDLVCRALASMRRSAARICEIVGEKDARCSRAQSQVESAAHRVERAGCTCKGG